MNTGLSTEAWLHHRFPPTSDAAPVAVHVDSLATRVTLHGATLTLFVVIMSTPGLVLLVASANGCGIERGS